MKHSVSKEDKELLKQDKPWLDAFLQEHYGVAPKKKNAKKVWVTLTACAAAVALVLTLALCLPRVFRSSDTGKTDMNGEKHYSLENQATTASNLAEVNQCLQGFSLQVLSDYELEVSRFYDKFYNETLYFMVRVLNEPTLMDSTMLLYVNSNFECAKKIEGEKKQKTVGVFDLEYAKMVSVNDPIYTVSYRALTEYSGVTVYIEYTQLSLSENGDFFDFFAQTLLVK